MTFVCPFSCGKRDTPCAHGTLTQSTITFLSAWLSLKEIYVEPKILSMLEMRVVLGMRETTLQLEWTFVIITAFLGFVEKRMEIFLKYSVAGLTVRRE